MFSALRYRNYRYYWLGQFPSVLAQNMQYVALAWLVLHLTNSPALLGINGLVQSIPNVTLSFIGGAMADRMDRKRLLILTQAASAILFLGLGTLVAAELIEVWQVMVFSFLLGCVRSFDQPTRQGLLSLVVPTEEIPNAVPLGNLVWQGTRLVGPAVAGLLIAFVGIGHTFYFAGASFVLAILLFARMRLEPVVASDRAGTLLQNVVEGVRYILKSPTISVLIGLTFFNSVFGMSYQLMMPIMARDILGVGPEGYGFLQTAGAVGSLLGTFGVVALGSRVGRGWQMLIGAAAFGAVIVAFAASSSYALSLGLLFVLGLANQVYMTTVNTTLQMTVPNEFRGRVMGVWGLTWSLQPLGGTVAGGIAEVAGVPFAIGIGGVLVTIMAVALGFAVPRIRRL
jgi:MFS family permease